MKVAIVFCAVVALAVACDFDESSYSTIRKGSRSAAEDDAEATATCQKGETLVACKCETFASDPEPCDGSNIKEDADGFSCVARNGAFGNGVVAVATCQETVITCESETGDMPSVSCPQNFKPMSCTMHSSFLHQMESVPANTRPRSKRNGNNCLTTKGCTNCKVQARCIRTTAF